MSETPPIQYEPGQGLCLDLTPYRKLTFPWPGGDFMEPRHQQLLLRLGGDFFPRASTIRKGRVIYQLTAGGRDVTEEAICLADLNEGVPSAELARLRSAMSRLRAEAEDPALSEKDRAVLDFFRLPSPAHDPELYWLYGPPEDRRILILWGLEKVEFASLPPESAVDCLPMARGPGLVVEAAGRGKGSPRRRKFAWPALAMAAALAVGAFAAWQFRDQWLPGSSGRADARDVAARETSAVPAKSGSEIASVPLPPTSMVGETPKSPNSRATESVAQSAPVPASKAAAPEKAPAAVKSEPLLASASPKSEPQVSPNPVETKPAPKSPDPDKTVGAEHGSAIAAQRSEPTPKPEPKPVLVASLPDQPSPEVKPAAPSANPTASPSPAPTPAVPATENAVAAKTASVSAPPAPTPTPSPAPAPAVAAQAKAVAQPVKAPPQPAVPTQMFMSGLSMPSVTVLPADSYPTSRATISKLPVPPSPAKATVFMEMRMPPVERRPMRVAQTQFPPAAGCIYHASGLGPVPTMSAYSSGGGGSF